QGDKKASGTSSKSGEKKEATEKTASASVSQPPKTQTSGAPCTAKKQSPSADAPVPPIMKSSEVKSTPTVQTEPGKSAQSTKAKSPITPSVATASKPNNTGKESASLAEQPSQAASAGTAQPKVEKTTTAGGAGAAGAGAVAGVVAAADKPDTESAMDESALDSLIDTLGGTGEDVAPIPVYTGLEITENISSEYLEELGKREGSLPPEYLALLKSKVGGKDGGLPKVDERSEKPMTDDELADALSSDFTCSTATAEEKKTTEVLIRFQHASVIAKQNKDGEVIQAQAASSVKTSVPPKEKKTKSKEEIKEDAMEALMATIGGPEPEPEPKDVSTIVEVSEAKAKEKKEKKTGERDDTIPPEYRSTPQLDKDGKQELPKPEEKHKPLSESDLVDEFSKDFASPAQPAVESKPSKPSSTSKVGHVAGEALEALSSSQGKREPDPEEKKPAVDKVKPMSENDLLEGLTEGFSPAQSAQLPTKTVKKGGKEMDDALDLLSDSLGQREPDPNENKPVVDKVKEKAKSEHRDKLGERDDTLPPDYQKLLESSDKVRRNCCFLINYFAVTLEIYAGIAVCVELQGEEWSWTRKQGKPVKPTPKDASKNKEQKKPADDSAAIDALSGDFDTSPKTPATPQHSKEKSGKETVTTKAASKDERKPKDHKKVEMYYSMDSQG
ncbi:hypothetical protein ASZ78_013564, partial [Callipepla squamata]